MRKTRLMKIKLHLAIFAFLLIGFSACQKPLQDEDLIYLGAWSSSKHFIEISANGFGFYQRRNRELQDCNVRITNRRIIFDWDGGRKSFRIDTAPAIEISTGRVFMTLDGRDFYRH